MRLPVNRPATRPRPLGHQRVSVGGGKRREINKNLRSRSRRGLAPSFNRYFVRLDYFGDRAGLDIEEKTCQADCRLLVKASLIRHTTEYVNDASFVEFLRGFPLNCACYDV